MVLMWDLKVMDNKLRGAANGKGTVSTLYKLVGLSSPNSNIPTPLHWEQDLGVFLTAVQWDAIWKNIDIQLTVRYKIIQMVLHRLILHLTGLIFFFIKAFQNCIGMAAVRLVHKCIFYGNVQTSKDFGLR